MNRKIFREYDIRGLVDEDLAGDIPGRLGKSFGAMARRQGQTTVAVGGDNRVSTPEIKEKLISGLCAAGCDVVDIGIVPTPVLYYALHTQPFSTGIMVTASHNPPEFNGFKMVVGKKSIYGAQIQELSDLMESGNLPSGAGKKSTKDITTGYCAFLKERFRFSRKLRIGTDTGNGVAGPLLVPLLKELGVEVSALYEESDGRFPHHTPDPVVPENMKDLSALVQREKLEAGLGIDGDGDRLGIADEHGHIIWGDRLLIIYAREILRAHPGGAVVFDVKCTNALAEEVTKSGGVPIMWKTGHSLIEDKMHEEKAVLAGELSGHLYFADEYFGYDDAIYSSLRLLRILDRTGKKPTELLAGVKNYFSTPEIRIEAPDERKFDVVRKLQDYFRGKFPVSEIDGVKVFFPDGWALVRASNTQPALVIRLEADNPSSLEQRKKEFFSVIEKFTAS